MYLIVGLGNIGKEYDGTRHNIGFEVIDYLSAKKGIAVKKKEQNGLTGVYHEFGEKILLAKPTTYMNNSGLCVAGLVNFYQVPPENLLVIYDDIDLATGAVRIRQRGSAGTHNGMRSIIQHLGSQDFPRIRIGTGRPKEGADLVHFVLGRFAKSELPLMENAVTEAARGIDFFVKDGVDLAMNQVNIRKKPEESDV
ncbi:aminoacyl-tRNA hydrolase [Acetobacterium fimetarium]|uniref:Peptidyl-tRNA hydrolase n=1 Tax=Acetobacterium fimetarium TaxID=52691 RepID=A0ABR6WSS5_9FIRM|nr:aminoacyl-tRNA hydrolase [Acetobacterium fimetarium]MBC3803597.1 aminoacyl-tRNA hydrolase [Acetobacterium fimetarium]